MKKAPLFSPKSPTILRLLRHDIHKGRLGIRSAYKAPCDAYYSHDLPRTRAFKEDSNMLLSVSTNGSFIGNLLAQVT